jgi:F-type H+-transporting ATPase subunit epsilon
MALPFKVDLVSPEKVLFSGEADMVITRTLEGGEIAFQAGHAPFLGALVENHTRIYLTDGTVQDVAVHRGFVEVSGDPTTVSILSDTAELADEIDIARAREAMERHQRLLKQETDEAALTESISAIARAEARLAAKGETSGFTA